MTDEEQIAAAYAAIVGDSLSPDEKSSKLRVLGYGSQADRNWNAARTKLRQLVYALATARAAGGVVEETAAKLRSALTAYRTELATALANTDDPLDATELTSADSAASSLASSLSALTFSTRIPTFEQMRDG